MDYHIHNIKMFVCLVSAPDRHTVHKTIRASREKRGQALHRENKSPPVKCSTLCGLLNEYLMAVDFANYRETDRHSLFIRYLSGCRADYLFLNDNLLIHLTAWQCYIAKYP